MPSRQHTSGKWLSLLKVLAYDNQTSRECTTGAQAKQKTVCKKKNQHVLRKGAGYQAHDTKCTSDQSGDATAKSSDQSS